jgi:hypothetical protein
MSGAEDAPTQAMTQQATEQGAALSGAVRDQAADVAHTARAGAGDVVHTARSETEQVVERTKDAVGHEARQRTEELAASVRRIGDGLGALADGRPEDAGPVAGYARDAAARVGDVAQRLETRGYDGIVEDVSGFARRRPGVFLAGAGLLGFAVGRMLRSGAASGTPGGGSGTSSPSGSHGTGSRGMGDATISMQPAMPRGEPSTPLPIGGPSGVPTGVPTGTQLR